jgi:hypothetical protein
VLLIGADGKSEQGCAGKHSQLESLTLRHFRSSLFTHWRHSPRNHFSLTSPHARFEICARNWTVIKGLDRLDFRDSRHILECDRSSYANERRPDAMADNQ